MRPAPLVPSLLAAILCVAACSRPEAPAPTATPPAPVQPAKLRAASEPTPSELTVIVLGDSLAAGYGLAEAQAFPAILQESLRSEGLPVRVLNAGISGDTSAGGLERLDWLLKQRPDVLVLELGANDGLRGLPLENTEANLRAIIERSHASAARVLLVGMQVPTSLGSDYAGSFSALFPRVAAQTGVALVPFLLEGVALSPELNLPDGIHPTAAGQRRLAENVLPHLRPLLAR